MLIVLQVKRVDVEGVDNPQGVLQPHGGAVEVNQHPLVRVKVEGVGLLYALHEVAVFRTDEGRTSVGCVYVQPDVVIVADLAKLVKPVEGAG